MTYAARLESRALFEIKGPDTRDFLQNILTNNMDRVTEKQAIYTALLTPQGKYQFDFFMLRNTQNHDSYLIDCAADRRDDLIKRLTFYKLRAKATIEKRDDLKVAALFGGDVLREMALDGTPGQVWESEQGLVVCDPRLSDLGVRLIYSNDAALETFNVIDETSYGDHMLLKGVPDPQKDAELEKDFLLELNTAELHGVDFAKGCFIGQELVSRMRNRHTVKKRLLPFTYDGLAPDQGAALIVNGKQAGEVRRVTETGGMAYIRLNRLENPLEREIQLETETGVPVTLTVPDWIPQPFPFYSTKDD